MRYYYTVSLLGGALLAGSPAVANVPVISGGVGDQEESYILQQEDQYNLKLVYTGEKGMYLSGVDVTIRDHEGYEVIHGLTQGPFLLAELAPGKYTVESSIEGLQNTQTVHIDSGLKTYQVRFPVKDEDERASLNERLEDKGYSINLVFPNMSRPDAG